MQACNHVLRWIGPGLAASLLFLLPVTVQAGPRGSFGPPPGQGGAGNFNPRGTLPSGQGMTTRPWTGTLTQPSAPTVTTHPSYPNSTSGYTPNYTPSYTPGYVTPNYTPGYTPTVPTNTPPSTTPSVPSNVVTQPAAAPTPPKNVVGNFAPPTQPNKISHPVTFGLTAGLKTKVTRDLQDVQDSAQNQVQGDLSNYVLDADAQNQLVQTALQQTKDPAKASALAAAFAKGDPELVTGAMLNAGFSNAKIQQTIAAMGVTQKYQNYQNALAGGSPDAIAKAQQQLEQAYGQALKANQVGPAQQQQQEQQLAQDLTQLNAAQQASSLLASAATSGGPPNWQMAGDTVTVVSCSDLPPGQVDVAGPGLVLTGAPAQQGTSVSTESLSALGVPLAAGQPVPAADADYHEGDTVLTNSAESGGPVSYVINQQTYTMQPGYSQDLPAGQSWQVTFDRGGSFGQAQYRLAPGQAYEFSSTSHGWELYKKTYQATLDNSTNPNPFNYLRGADTAQVPARQQATVTGTMPILVVFDPGNGQSVRRLLKDGTYRVGLNPKTGLLDLLAGKPTIITSASPGPVRPGL